MDTPGLLMVTMWERTLATGQRTWDIAQQVGVALLILLALLVVAWITAAVASGLTRALLHASRFDEAVRRLTRDGGPARLQPSRAVASMVKLAVWMFAVLFGLELLGLHFATSVGERLAEVIPRVVTSSLLLGAGTVIAIALGTLTRHLLERAGMRGGRLQGQGVTVVAIAVAILIALEQLGFAAQFVMTLGVIAATSAGLALALAFGLGCRDLARDFLVEYLRAVEDSEPGTRK